MLLWLAAYPHRSRRLRIPAVDGNGTRRVRLTLPREAWFLQRLQQGSVPCDWSGGPQVRRCSLVIGLVEVSFGMSWHGALTLFSAEVALLRGYFQNPLDAFSMTVSRTLRLQEPVSIFAAEGRQGKPWSLSSYVQEDALDWPAEDAHGQLHNVGSILTRWGYEGPSE